MKTRIYFLDNLRTFMIFLVILLHAGIVYEPILGDVWPVSDPAKNSNIGLVRMYLDLFIMFTLFFVSGYFTPMSLRKKTSWGFIKSKFMRLMVPWLLAVLILIPVYKVIFLYSRGLPQEAWYTYFHFYQKAGGNPWYFADNPTQSWLWYLPILFVFQVVYLLLSKTRALKLNVSMPVAVTLTFVIGLAYSMVISGMDLTGWHHSALLHFQRERLLIYFMVFLLGSLSYKLKVFDTKIKSKRMYILANVVLTLSLGIFTAVALNFFFNMIEPGRNYFFISKTIDGVAYYSTMLLSMFSFIYIFIRTFQSYFNKSNPLMANLNRNSYAVYIIHMIVLAVFALVMVRMDMPVLVKYLLLTVLTFTVSNVLVSIYTGLKRVAQPRLAGSREMAFSIKDEN